MQKLGLTGSIATGKSTVLQMFADLGVPVFSSDEVVHALYSGEAVAPVEALFPGVSHNDGVVDRAERSSQPAGRAIPSGWRNSKRRSIRWSAPGCETSSPKPRPQGRRLPWSTCRCCSRPASTTGSTASR